MSIYLNTLNFCFSMSKYLFGNKSEVDYMKSTVILDQVTIEKLVKSSLPEEFLPFILKIDVCPLKSKYSDDVVKNVFCSNVVITVKSSPFRLNIESKVLCKLLPNYIYFPEKKELGLFEPNSPYLRGVIIDQIFTLCLNEQFDCCGYYLECSNAKKCLHPDPFYSISCTYRKHLINGNIFYGVNKNV